MSVVMGNGGWLRVVEAGLPEIPGRVYLRLQMIDGRPRMTGLFIEGLGEPIPAAGLRTFPVQMFEQMVGGVPDVESYLERKPGPDLSRLAAWFAATGDEIEAMPDNWVKQSFLAQEEGSGVPQAPEPEQLADFDASNDIGSVEGVPMPTLDAPRDGLTDDFLGQVAQAYDAAVRARKPPATTLAEMTGYSRRTVESWFLKARKRGLMPPATSRGRVV